MKPHCLTPNILKHKKAMMRGGGRQHKKKAKQEDLKQYKSFFCSCGTDHELQFSKEKQESFAPKVQRREGGRKGERKEGKERWPHMPRVGKKVSCHSHGKPNSWWKRTKLLVLKFMNISAQASHKTQASQLAFWNISQNSWKSVCYNGKERDGENPWTLLIFPETGASFQLQNRTSN